MDCRNIQCPGKGVGVECLVSGGFSRRLAVSAGADGQVQRLATCVQTDQARAWRYVAQELVQSAESVARMARGQMASERCGAGSKVGLFIRMRGVVYPALAPGYAKRNGDPLCEGSLQQEQEEEEEEEDPRSDGWWGMGWIHKRKNKTAVDITPWWYGGWKSKRAIARGGSVFALVVASARPDDRMANFLAQLRFTTRTRPGQKAVLAPL